MIVGRQKEQSELLGLMDKEESQFCVVYGRRRVGKTYLIRETFHYQFSFQHTGVANGNLRQQLTAFRNSLRNIGVDCAIPTNWIEAFELLKTVIVNAPAGKKVIFIDELPWMDTSKSNLIGALESFWNGWATARAEKDIILIVCGSATSWITKKLLKNKGGLRGRLTTKIKVEPFTLAECEVYAKASGLIYSRRDILELYMALGGIPYYWSFLKKGLSVAQNMDELFFSEVAQLRDEFEALYHVLFKRPDNYICVIDAMSKNRKAGMTREEILKATRLSDGGTFTNVLEELEQCGFIRRYVSVNKKEKESIFQLIDNYTLFYYHCIKKNAFSDENYWTHTYLSGEHAAWTGLAFERVCLQHVSQIKQSLGISGILTNVCSWSKKATAEHKGAQIDLLLQRADGITDVCEMKYAKSTFAIDGKYAGELQRKLDVLSSSVKSMSTLHLVMITTQGVSRNEHWSMVQHEVTIDDLFRS